MNLVDHQKRYVLDDGHWYVSKIKQYNEKSINLMAKQLNCLVKLFSLNFDKELLDKFNRFKIKDSANDGDKTIYITPESKLFISIYLLSENLIDSSQLEHKNKSKYQDFKSIQLEFLEDKNYEFFVNKYEKSFLVNDLAVYYRNAKSWLGKYGFYGEYVNGRAYVTDAGLEFAKNCNSIETTSALFTYQLKKYQIWNPTLPSKYDKYRIRPYYLLLQLIKQLPDNYFTQDEYILFISKIKSHNPLELKDTVNLIAEFRLLSTEDKKNYINELNALDKKKNSKAKRTNYETIKDSSAKELPLYTWGNIINQGVGEYVNCYVLNDRKKLEENLKDFENSIQFIEFDEKLDWIKYLGELKNISLEDIVEMYLRDGKSADEIKGRFSNAQDIDKIIGDKLYEREIEEYYFHNIGELDKNLVVLSNPMSGRQFPTHIGPIDLLCKDKKTDEYVIVELKRGHTNDEVIGQVLRYMGWVYINLEKSNKSVRGYVVANEFSENIDYSLMGMQSNFSYDLIKPIKHPFTDQNRPKLKMH
jgi:hypothetical protein